jgi:hypothetical protein
MLAAYLANREGPAETFMEFSRRLDSDAIKRLVDAQGASA